MTNSSKSNASKQIINSILLNKNNKMMNNDGSNDENDLNNGENGSDEADKTGKFYIFLLMKSY